MGAAFSIPLIENKHKVTLSEPHNIKLINKLNLKKKFHPSFKTDTFSLLLVLIKLITN